MLLFLDFDGVLHPLCPTPDRSEAENRHFSYLPRLEDVLRDHPDVRIVVASDWRKLHTLEELQAFFAPDIAERVIGVTPLDPSSEYVPGRRQRRVEEYLEQHGRQGEPWVAIDDDCGNYDLGANLVLCNDGFRDAEERALRTVLSGGENSAARVLAAAARLSGDRDRALARFSEHRITSLGEKTAEELVIEGRAEQVLKYMEMVSVRPSG